ncbi:IS481 family transposase domain protein [Rickettsiales endosymbiont of Paramecium tredecaurelia]|nr:IS481 family transposase domain protein [Candidatus Sarmatiella mevalonica]
MEKNLMGQILHANARTTEAIRREIRDSKESIEKAAKRFNVNPKTIIKWRKREDTKDLPMGPKNIRCSQIMGFNLPITIIIKILLLIYLSVFAMSIR